MLMKCKNCKDAKENCCCHCGKSLTLMDSNNKYRANPYNDEILDDCRNHLMCDVCYEESCMEI